MTCPSQALCPGATCPRAARATWARPLLQVARARRGLAARGVMRAVAATRVVTVGRGLGAAAGSVVGVAVVVGEGGEAEAAQSAPVALKA